MESTLRTFLSMSLLVLLPRMSGAVTPTWSIFAYHILPLLTAQFSGFVIAYFLFTTDQPAHIGIIVSVALGLSMLMETILADRFKSNDGVITDRENAALLFFFTLKIFFGFVLPPLVFAVIRDDLASSPTPNPLQLLVLGMLIMMLVIAYTGFLGRTILGVAQTKTRTEDGPKKGINK